MHVNIIARSITLEACHMSMCLVLSFAGLVSVMVTVLCFSFGFVFAGGGIPVLLCRILPGRRPMPPGADLAYRRSAVLPDRWPRWSGARRRDRSSAKHMTAAPCS